MDNSFDIDLLKNGNTQEFHKVYHYFMPRLNGYFYAKGSADYLNADIIQQTFIKLWENRKRLNGNVKLSTQIFQIAKTVMIDELRKENSLHKRKQYISEQSKYETYTLSSNNDYLEEKELHVQLNRAINLLPPTRKTVFLLSRENNLSQKEISSKLSISVKTVNKHIQLALKQIKPYIGLMEILFLLILSSRM